MPPFFEHDLHHALVHQIILSEQNARSGSRGRAVSEMRNRLAGSGILPERVLRPCDDTPQLFLSHWLRQIVRDAQFTSAADISGAFTRRKHNDDRAGTV